MLSPEVVDCCPKLVWHMDEPIADPAAITTYLICSAARERLTVVLSGMGADEIFAGYPAPPGRAADPAGRLPPPRLRGAIRTSLEGRLTIGKARATAGPSAGTR